MKTVKSEPGFEVAKCSVRIQVVTIWISNIEFLCSLSQPVFFSPDYKGGGGEDLAENCCCASEGEWSRWQKPGDGSGIWAGHATNPGQR